MKIDLQVDYAIKHLTKFIAPQVC